MNLTVLRFQPLLKQLIWGGRRLGDLLGKPIGTASDYAESWEIVDHGHDQSIVAEGPLAGTSLGTLVAERHDWLMGAQSEVSAFPLLLKFLDCSRVLSVQVHPDDAYASRMKVPDRGKTEAWYVIDSAPESLIYAGLQAGVTKKDLEQAIAQGATEKLLHRFHPEPGDCVFIPAGTVHAIGAGLLVAEIQQSSDTTFRIFDWNRKDAAGNLRQLHVQQSLDVIDFESGPVQPIRRAADSDRWETLVDCDKFRFSMLSAGTGSIGGDDRCHLLTVPKGSAVVRTRNQEITVGLGETVLVPASLGMIECEVPKGACLLEMQPRE
jgi:mannose-6-phosphate isomerase